MAAPPTRTQSIQVTASLPGQRLDVYLPAQFPAVSRGAFQRLIAEGHVRVNGKTVKATYAPRAGDQIEIFFPEARPAEAQPEDIPLDILFEDEHVLVLNKPPGLVVHPAAGHEAHTLVNALLHHCAGQLSGIGGVARPGIVHRIDKETSGCLVVAKTDPAHQALAEQFAGRTVTKSYRALVCGSVTPEEGEIRAAIARHPSHRKRMAVTAGQGRAAYTSYRRVEYLCGVTDVEVFLHTGRTHQIRVHFQHIGFPLVGDSTYGKRQNARLQQETGYVAPRVMLHAHRLEFAHPATGELRRFEAPLPRDFQAAVAELRINIR